MSEYLVKIQFEIVEIKVEAKDEAEAMSIAFRDAQCPDPANTEIELCEKESVVVSVD